MSTLMDALLQTKDKNRPVLTTFGGSYHEADLISQIEAYAALLGEENIRGKRIALLVPHTFSYLALVMAINRLGGVVVPVSWQYRADDLKELLKLLDPHMIFTIAHHGGFPFADVFEEWAKTGGYRTVIYTSKDGFAWEAQDFGSVEKPLERSGADFICSTSGSTGVPKGIMVNMRGIQAIARFLHDMSAMNSRDRYFTMIPPTSVMGIATVCAGFGAGVQLVSPDSFELPQIVKLLKETRANKILTTPSVLKAVHLFAKNMAPEVLGHLEFCGLSGENMTEEIVQQVPLNEGCRFAGLYGISEMGGVLYCDLRQTAEWSAYRDVEYALAEDGELLIRTPAAFIGYYKRPDLTSQVWTKDGWFKTGDWVRLKDNNKLEIIGRKKDMIKKGGQQVIPGEIEKVLLGHPNVKQAAVLGAPHPVYGEQVVAFAVLYDESTSKELLSYCAERIARFKVPDVLEIVQDIPIIQGKADKITLRNLFLSKKG